MNLSWSEKLFLKINSYVGKNRFLDKLAYFCGVLLIYILGTLVLGWGAFILFDRDPAEFDRLIKLLITVHVFGIGISYLVAVLWRHSRPIVKFPDIKRVFATMETWKSFPSDHTTISFLFVFVAIIVGASFWFGLVLVCLAFCVGSARVYCGVHYPRDIVGGIVWAGLVALASPWLLEHITQPVYSAVKLFF